MYDVSRQLEFVRPKLVHTKQTEKITLVNEVIHCNVFAHWPYITGSTLWNKLDANIQMLEAKKVYKLRIKNLYSTTQNPDT